MQLMYFSDLTPGMCIMYEMMMVTLVTNVTLAFGDINMTSHFSVHFISFC